MVTLILALIGWSLTPPNLSQHRFPHSDTDLDPTTWTHKGKQDTMASVVPSASCYDRRAPRPMHLLGRPGGEAPSPFGSCGHRSGGRPRLVTHAPKMTLKQICQLLRAMRQVPPQESGSALAVRDEAAFLPNSDSSAPGATEH